MNEEIIRLKKLAGILTESVQAVPGIGKKHVPEETESEMQTAATAAVNQGDAKSDEAIANTMATEDEEHLYEAKKMTAKNKAKEKVKRKTNDS
jgi:biotin-(acetyl-CoA carboxylase) ligase